MNLSKWATAVVYKYTYAELLKQLDLQRKPQIKTKQLVVEANSCAEELCGKRATKVRAAMIEEERHEGKMRCGEHGRV